VEPRDVVVVGGSAGSLRPLLDLARALPADLQGSVAVTIHMGERAKSRLPWLLSRAGPLPAAHAEAGKRLEPGHVYVAPPGCHLLLPAGLAELSGGPRVNRHRPAVDAMFASAARWFGNRAVAVVLSGLLDDGAIGTALVARAGGLVVVQEPDDADQPSMPRAALAAAPDAVVAPGKELGDLVGGMLGESGLATWPRAQLPDDGEVRMEETSDLRFLSPGKTRPTRLACPECGGALAAQAESAEAKLWAAVATLEETAALARHLARHDGLGQDAAGEQQRTAGWGSELAESLRAQIGEIPQT
jgi:two-component system, chemotaxis family, protein-glutamate methylesterase/glutaminase